MAQVLALYYSLTHNTDRVMQELVGALREAGHTVTLEALRPIPPFPLPAPPELLNRLLRQALTGRWPVVDLEPLSADISKGYDLILVGYQPWYMTPSVPVNSFLKGPQGFLLQGRPVIGIMTCRAMYRRATAQFRQWTEEIGGQVIEQRVFVDQDPRPSNFVSLIHMLKHGRDPERGPLRWLLKPFGVGEPGLRAARAYGRELAARLAQGPLNGRGEVRVAR